MSIILTHPTGNRNFRYLLESLAKKRKLKYVFTNLNIDTNNKLLKLLPKNLNKLLKIRDFNTLMNNTYSISPIYEIVRVLLNKLNIPYLKSVQLKFFNNHKLYKRFSLRVSKKIKKIKNVDMVYGYEGSSLEIFQEAKKRGIKCIYELPTLYWKAKELTYKKEKKKYPKYSKLFISEDTKTFAKRVDEEINLADTIIVPSLQVKKSLSLHKKKNLKIKVLNYPFPKPLTFKNKKWYNPKRKIEVLFVGMLEARKGLHLIIETLKLLKKKKQFENFKFTIIGNGTMINYINNKWKNIEYFSSMPNHQVLNRMKNSDIYLSLSSFEGYALTPIEAMSKGMTVICSRFCGFTDKCNKKDVIILDNINPIKIYNSLIQLQLNPKLVKNIGLNALKTCKKYQLSDYKKHLLKFLYK